MKPMIEKNAKAGRGPACATSDADGSGNSIWRAIDVACTEWTETAKSTEKQFYSLYDWCLNPALSVRELLQRFGEELERYKTLPFEWQREESRINLYLFVCAISCTVDDYLAAPLRRLAPLSAYFPRLRTMVDGGQRLLDTVQYLRKMCVDRSVRAWRRRAERCIDQACEMLLETEERREQLFGEFQHESQEWFHNSFPSDLLARRMRLPEAFRCQDFTHQDVIALLRVFVESSAQSRQPHLIIGLRTAGSYFAPLMAAYLRLLHWPRVSWMTIRPKNGLSAWEAGRLQSLLDAQTRVLLVDDYPNTGLTFKLALQQLRRFKVPAERIYVLAPRHTAKINWSLPSDVKNTERIGVFTLPPEQLHKAHLLDSKNIEPLIQNYYRIQGWQEARVVENQELDRVNARLWEHYADGFQVRLKRVIAVRLGGPDGTSVLKKLFVKSCGWGWLGYHSYISGTRLSGFVPPIVGLRNGFLMSEWIEGEALTRGSANREDVLATLSSYIAGRARLLRLRGDIWLDSNSYRWTGWDAMLGILRGAYGSYIWPLKVSALRSELRRYLSPVAALTDGKMEPEEWIASGTKLLKTDFEHHNFGGGELDIVDPAYDLASAVFEFALPAQSEEQLLRTYAIETSDNTIFDRILLYKLLYGSVVMRRALHRLCQRELDSHAEAENARYLQAKKFLTFLMNQFAAGLGERPEVPIWSKALFFLDLDGVFDQERLGFAHTTWLGLQALRILQANGYSVVLNTGRSVEHVRNYCRAYTLPGGLAEYGSVFVDAVRGTETPLIHSEAAEQLELCREELRKHPGVFTDPGYRYSIRAYRFHSQGTASLDLPEITQLLSAPKFDQLTFFSRAADTYIFQKGRGKGPGLLAAKALLKMPEATTAAIGDAEEDEGMLRAAQFAYAPANISAKLRRCDSDGKFRIMSRPFQRGLMDAVLDLIPHAQPRGHSDGAVETRTLNGPNELIRTLLQAADRPLPRQILSVLQWRSV